MSIKSSFIAALAMLSLASLTPLSDAQAQARSVIEARDNNGNTNGSAIIIYNEAGTGTYIFAAQQSLNYCQQFQPVHPNGFSVYGYVSRDLVTSFYKNSNCAGTPALTVSKANGNEVNNKSALGLVYSFQALYKKG